MALIDKLKRDFARHKAKAGILAALGVVMLVFIGKAVFDMTPRAATAADPLATNATLNPEAATSSETEEHVRQSKELWKTLLEKRGIDSSVAFTFDSTSNYYNLDPNRKIVAATPKVEVIDNTPKQPVTNAEAEFAKRHATLIEDSRTLIVRSTLVGSGMSKPVAVIHDSQGAGGDRIFGVGDRIKGFEITAIRAREIEIKKEGITLVVEMAHDPSN